MNDLYRELMAGRAAPAEVEDRADGDDFDLPATPERLPDLLASPSGLGATDLGNAARLARVMGDSAIYVIGKGWGLRDGSRYSFRGGEIAALEAAQVLPEIIRAEADAAAEAPVTTQDVDRVFEGALPKATKVNSPAAAAFLLRTRRRAHWDAFATRCESLNKIEAALKGARPKLLRDIEDLDSDPWSLTVPNGRVDLRAAVDADLRGLDPDEEEEARRAWLKPQDWASLPTKCAGAPYDPAATCPRFDAFLELIQPDPETRAFVQRCMGLTVFGRNFLQVALLLKGPGGNGKSTLMEAVAKALGDRDGYAFSAKAEMFLVTQGDSPGKATPEEVDLPGARAMIASETSPTDQFSGKKIKSLTGGDRRPCRALNKDQFYYTPRAIPIISFNDTPVIKDCDEGTRRRLVFVPFDVSLHKLPEERRRRPDDVAAELAAEASGILNWLIDGFRAVQRGGLTPPTSAAALKDSQMSDADPVGTFLRDMTEEDPEGLIGVTALHSAFVAWCSEAGAQPWGPRAFGRAVLEKRLVKHKSSAWFWRGAHWKADDFTRRVLDRAEIAPPAAERPVDFDGAPF